MSIKHPHLKTHRRMTTLLLVFVMFISGTITPAHAGDELGEVLGALFGTTGGGTTGAYRFRPGDLIVERSDFAAYYTGWQPAGPHRVLLLRMRLPNAISYTVRYTDPDIIALRDLTLEIIDFNNTELRMRQVRRPL